MSSRACYRTALELTKGNYCSFPPYISYVSSGACYRTALELTKVIIALFRPILATFLLELAIGLL